MNNLRRMIVQQNKKAAPKAISMTLGTASFA